MASEIPEPLHERVRDRRGDRLVRRLPAHDRRDRRLGQPRRRRQARGLEAPAGAARRARSARRERRRPPTAPRAMTHGRFLVRSGFAVRVSRVRATARSVRRPLVQRRATGRSSSARCSRHFDHKGPAEIEPKRAWTFRQVHWLGAPRADPDRHAGAPSVQPARPVAPRLGDRARGGTPSRFVCETVLRHVWRGGADAEDPAAPGRARGAARARASIRRATRTSSACATRPTRRSRAASSACRRSASATSCSGASTPSTWPPRSCAATPGSMRRTGSAKARRAPASSARERWLAQIAAAAPRGFTQEDGPVFRVGTLAKSRQYSRCRRPRAIRFKHGGIPTWSQQRFR